MEAPPHELVVRSDVLPPYHPNISVTGRLLCKQELLSPEVTAFDRHWHRIEAELRGTKLLYEVLGSNSSIKPLRSYTLQAADVGLASDYKQRSDVFRARIKGEQLLFIAPDMEAAVAWVEALLTAVVISHPLESRKMPKYPSLPSRRAKHVSGEMITEGLGKRLWEESRWRARQRRA